MAVIISNKKIGKETLRNFLKDMTNAAMDLTSPHELHNQLKLKHGELQHSDGWGLVFLNKHNKFEIYKDLIPLWKKHFPSDLFKQIANSTFVMIHFRLASPGLPININYLHPFSNQSSLGRAYLVHNGTIDRDTIPYEQFNSKLQTKSDTEALLYYFINNLERSDVSAYSRVLKESLQSIDPNQGANYFLVLEKLNKIYVSTNHKGSRESFHKYYTLKYFSNEDLFIVASEQLPSFGSDWTALENGNTLEINLLNPKDIIISH